MRPKDPFSLKTTTVLAYDHTQLIALTLPFELAAYFFNGAINEAEVGEALATWFEDSEVEFRAYLKSDEYIRAEGRRKAFLDGLNDHGKG